MSPKGKEGWNRNGEVWSVFSGGLVQRTILRKPFPAFRIFNVFDIPAMRSSSLALVKVFGGLVSSYKLLDSVHCPLPSIRSSSPVTLFRNSATVRFAALRTQLKSLLPPPARFALLSLDRSLSSSATPASPAALHFSLFHPYGHSGAVPFACHNVNSDLGLEARRTVSVDQARPCLFEHNAAPEDSILHQVRGWWVPLVAI